MKKISDYCLKLLSKAIASVCLFSVSVSVGTISLYGVYEHPMPATLIPKDKEEGV